MKNGVSFVRRLVAVCLILVPLGVLGESAVLAKVDSKSATGVPRPDHVVIVIEENKSFNQIIGNGDLPYINSLAERGALFTQSYGVAYPSQPNYLALFSGSTHEVNSNKCPLTLAGDNLASELSRKGLTFAIYSESMPWSGFERCKFLGYARKHNPVANWPALGAASEVNLPFRSFPDDYTKLPTVSFVVPNQKNDMHDDLSPAGFRRADDWLKDNLGPYVDWAMTHNSLLILTWDEDDHSSGNRIPTIFVGSMVNRGVNSARITHYNVLRTIIEMYDLQPMGETRKTASIGGIWKR